MMTLRKKNRLCLVSLLLIGCGDDPRTSRPPSLRDAPVEVRSQFDVASSIGGDLVVGTVAEVVERDAPYVTELGGERYALPGATEVVLRVEASELPDVGDVLRFRMPRSLCGDSMDTTGHQACIEVFYRPPSMSSGQKWLFLAAPIQGANTGFHTMLAGMNLPVEASADEVLSDARAFLREE